MSKKRYTLRSEFVRTNIIRMRRNDPYATLKEIGDSFDITKERVRQVLSEAGKETRAYRDQVPHLCIGCGKQFNRLYNQFCSYECKRNETHTMLPCSYCGSPGKEVNIKWLNWEIDHGRHSPDLFFCSKVCQGNWLADNYGFVKYPEHIISAGRLLKWDYSKVYELRDRTGWGARRISRALGIPQGTLSQVLAEYKRANLLRRVS